MVGVEVGAIVFGGVLTRGGVSWVRLGMISGDVVESLEGFGGCCSCCMLMYCCSC